MSKFCVRTVVLVLVTVLSSAAPAKGRGHFGLGALGGIKLGFTRLFSPGLLHRARVHRQRAPVHQRRNTPPSAAVNQPPGEEALDFGRLFIDPTARGQTAATAALALWHGGRNGAGGWWSHGHGGFGWVGPLFWPFAYDDLYGYTVFGDRIGFWDYGYPDLYAGIFGPYGNDELAAYMAPGSSDGKEQTIPAPQRLCENPASQTAGLAIDQIQRRVEPREAQRTALERLADASKSAAQIIQATCPRQTASTAPARLEVMQERIGAMLNAVISLEPPLDALYDLLDDQQKARLNGLAEDRRKTAAANENSEAVARLCETSQSTQLQWPRAEIENELSPNDTQLGALEQLQRASARAAEMLNYECRPEDALTPPARLAAIDRRLDILRQAINVVSVALEGLYATLNDEQKSRFEMIGPQRVR